MINRASLDRLEDAIDAFETGWSEHSQTTIETLLQSHGLLDDHEAISELIRVDIELRYERGMSIELEDYLDRFEVLRDHPSCVADIAFEDYRSRSAKGYSISAKRWSDLPGVRDTSWFQDLAQTPFPQSERLRMCPLDKLGGEDNAFRRGLAEQGFYLVQQIASGTFSRVYLATQSELADRFVVLKIVDETLAEPERMALLQHTNIVPLYSFHQILDRSVICMPYSGCVTMNDFLLHRRDVSTRVGQSLIATVKAKIDETHVATFDASDPELLRRAASTRVPAANDDAVLRPMEAFESMDCAELAIWIFVRLAGALAHAHARGVLHNDLKPSNVLIRNDGEPALLDFNLSQSLGGPSPRHAGGTLPYMSPESLRALMGQDVRPKATSDVYSVGVMLYEFVTGRMPYPTPASPAAIDLAPAVDARRGPPVWCEKDAGSPGLRAIIEKCLRFDPQERYETADQLLMDLQQEQRSFPLVTAQEPGGWKLRKWSRRHPRLIASSLILLVCLGLLLPITVQAVRWYRDNQVLSAHARYEGFSTKSVEFLSRLMADPRRRAESNVPEGLQLLRQFGLDDGHTMREILQSYQGEERTEVETSIRRFVLHLAIIESKRLNRLRRLSSVTGADFGLAEMQRLDQLLDIAQSMESPATSRAALFLAAERRSLEGDFRGFETLHQSAVDTPAQSDTELYLESVRLLSEFKYVAAGEILTELADRKTIPSALRWTMLGRAQFAESLFEEAKLSFTQSIERAPESSALFVMRGRCFLEMNQGRKAISDFRIAVELDPNNVVAWTHLGIVHLARGDYADAIEMLDRALGVAPDRLTPLLKRSEAHRLVGNQEAAEADYQAAMNLVTNDPNELVIRAQARSDQDPQGALKDLNLALQMNRGRLPILMEIARTMAVELNDYENAAAIYEKVVEAQPDNEYARIDLALCLVRIGRIDDALQETRLAMQEPNLPRNVYQAACVHALINRDVNRRRAVELLAKAIQGGYRPKDLVNDPDLKALDSSPSFRAVVRFFEMAEQAFGERSVRRKQREAVHPLPFNSDLTYYSSARTSKR